jgi:hypothetical protein
MIVELGTMPKKGPFHFKCGRSGGDKWYSVSSEAQVKCSTSTVSWATTSDRDKLTIEIKVDEKDLKLITDFIKTNLQ